MVRPSFPPSFVRKFDYRAVDPADKPPPEEGKKSKKQSKKNKDKKKISPEALDKEKKKDDCIDGASAPPAPPPEQMEITIASIPFSRIRALHKTKPRLAFQLVHALGLQAAATLRREMVDIQQAIEAARSKKGRGRSKSPKKSPAKQNKNSGEEGKGTEEDAEKKEDNDNDDDDEVHEFYYKEIILDAKEQLMEDKKSGAIDPMDEKLSQLEKVKAERRAFERREALRLSRELSVLRKFKTASIACLGKVKNSFERQVAIVQLSKSDDASTAKKVPATKAAPAL